MINAERNVKQFFDLVAISSESLNEKEVAEYIYDSVKEMGYSVRFDNVEIKEGNSSNIIVSIPGDKNKKSILLSAHMDTVAPGEEIEPYLKDGYVYSRGETVLGADDKAGVAAILEMLTVIKENDLKTCPINIALTCAEEKGLMGAKKLNEKDVKSDMGYVLDSHGDVGLVINQAPYHYTIVFKVKGKAAHAGIHPEKGNNSIICASKAIVQLRQGRIDNETTVNVGVINGGVSRNIVPEYTKVKCEARSLCKNKVEEQVEFMEKAFKKVCKEDNCTLVVEKELEYDGYSVSENSFVVEHFKNVCNTIGINSKIISSNGGSDANVINKMEIPTIVLGVGMEDVHSTDERVSVENLNNLANVLVELVKV